MFAKLGLHFTVMAYGTDFTLPIKEKWNFQLNKETEKEYFKCKHGKEHCRAKKYANETLQVISLNTK